MGDPFWRGGLWETPSGGGVFGRPLLEGGSLGDPFWRGVSVDPFLRGVSGDPFLRGVPNCNRKLVVVRFGISDTIYLYDFITYR